MLLRALLIAHRYMAVAVGLLMALWCLSGFVMLYQQYPDFEQSERLQTLAPLDLRGCCHAQFLPADSTALGGFRIEMLGDRPVLRQAGVAPFDLVSGTPLRDLTQADMLDVARGYAARRGLTAEPAWLEEIEVDQWTVQTAPRNRPANRIALHDAAGTEIYVNGTTGEIFQETSRRERVLAWLGAIPHWLYPTVLRRNGPLWTQVVIWSSVIGCFLTATGLYVGISRLQRRRKDGKLSSPFRGWWYWHHVSGLIFGVLTLTWVFSGLLTMNPWGLLRGSDIGARLQPQIAGSATIGELRRFLRDAPGRLPAGEFRQLRAQAFGSGLHVIALRADGSSVRLDAAARPSPLTRDAVNRIVRGLDTGLHSLDLLPGGDAYYYPHKDDVELPVYRAILDDMQATRLYISPTTGAYRTVDRDGRQSRWLQRGLHGLDFDGLRTRPLWDVLTILLLAGVSCVCVTGSWMAIQRVRRDISRS
jgi:uncharacterized iron-regulated membrane protein